MLERLSQSPAALFSERELLDRDADVFAEYAAVGLLRRLPLDYTRPTIRYEGRGLRIVSGPTDPYIEAIDEEDIDFDPIRIGLEDVSRWKLDIAAWAREFALRHDAVEGARQVSDRIWWIGTAYAVASLYLLLPANENEVEGLLDGLPVQSGTRLAVIIPPHLKRMPQSPRPAPLLTWMTDDGLGTTPDLREAVIDPPPGGYLEPVPGFRHSKDFRSVYWQGESFPLTTQQARAVEILLVAFLNRTPEVSQAYILEEMEVDGSALRFVFRGSTAWNRLVVSGSTSGAFRLAL